MTIRITGLNSGLDTDSIIKELVSAYRAKGDKLKKQQTKLSWTQDKWKSLNAKVLNLYKSLDNMRFTAGYNMKKTSVSDVTKATVTASSSAVNGTQTLKIKQLAKGGYLTGAKIDDKGKGKKATLKDLGYDEGTTTFRLKGKNGDKYLEVDGNTKISDFISMINDSGAGVKASYDETNKRMYISSNETGAESDFTLTALDEKSAKALNALGVNTASATSNAEAAKWMEYYDPATGVKTDDLAAAVKALAQAKFDRKDYADKIEKKTAENSKYADAVKYLDAKESVDDLNTKYGAKDATSMSQLANMSEENLKKTYIINDVGELVEATQEQIDDPAITTKTGKEYFDDFKTAYNIQATETDSEGNEVETDAYKELKSYNSNKKAATAYEQEASNNDILNEIAAGKDAVAYQAQIDANKADIQAYNSKLDDAAKTLQKYQVLDSGAVVEAMKDVDLSQPLDPTSDFGKYVTTLSDRVSYFANTYKSDGNGGYVVDETSPNAQYISKGSLKVDGTDAKITLNGIEYESSRNTFNINGLSIQANAITGDNDADAITITTSTDTQGLYDKIKDFISEYNSIINEMSSLYNAESSKGYEPLTSEEKEALSESDVAEWEKKIKGSLLRRDSRLSTLMTAMTSAMSGSYEINGKKYSLATLGIKTAGYFTTTAANRYEFHIDGDPDDDTVSANSDKLMAMLNSDPDTVIDIMKKVTGELYDNLNKQMKPTELRSYQSIYNDKAMAISYSDYTKKISAWEEKVAKMEDSYYKKFAAMETALAKLQSQQSAFAGLLGS